MMVINLDEKENQNYDKVCQKIFNNYNYKIVLLGHGPKEQLPIPVASRYYLKKFKPKNLKQYQSRNYQPIENKKILKMLTGKVCRSLTTHTMGISALNYNGDVFKLWYQSAKIKKIDKVDTEDLLLKIFKVDDLEDIENIKIWNGHTMFHKDEQKRIDQADMKYPILMYQNYVIPILINKKTIL